MSHSETPKEDGTHGDDPSAVSSDYVSNRRFADFPISTATLQGIHDLGYTTATPVQAAAIEPAMGGADLIVRAKTGTGKTSAFSIPIIERIDDETHGPAAVILAPTRELAQQIAEECSALATHRSLSIAVLIGGVAMGPQEDALRDGAQLIVGTPGRVLDHIRRGNLDLSRAGTACLDEADEMLSMGFFEDVSSILDACPSERQILLFSATISATTQRLINRYTHSPEEILLSTDTDQVEGIDHVIYETRPGFHKVRALLYLLDLENPSSAIIFCNTREDAATVASFLDRQGLDAQLLSGELSQPQRSRVMKRVKRGEVRFLASTDVASRGIDISDLSHVINYSLPQDPAVYLHRSGRTGRIGKKGTAISLVGPTDLNTRRMLESVHHIPFETREFPDNETCIRKRVERQAEQIRAAMGTMAFEAYLPTVRALKEREDGDILLAAALRAFFQWDRARQARMSDDGSSSASPKTTARSDKRTLHGDKRTSHGKSTDSSKSTRGKSSKKGSRRGSRRANEEAPTRPSSASADDLDALLVTEDDLDVLLVSEPSAVARDSGEKRKRKKKRKAVDDNLDALLIADSPDEASPPDDLDAFLSIDG